MFGRKRSDAELIYADPLAEEKPSKKKRRGLWAILAALIAVVLVAVAVTVLIILVRDQNTLRLPELMPLAFWMLQG